MAMRSLAIALCFLSLTTLAAPSRPPSTCGLPGDNEAALCAYQSRNFTAAEQGFRAIVERDSREPRTLRAIYFLSRTLMKTGRYDEASKLLIRIYTLDRPFYDGWNCDFLLGECRRARGQS